MLDNPPTTIASILRSAVGARYLGDDYPRWRQGRDDRRSKTIEEAAHERDLLAKALRRDGSERALDLAAVLDACSSRRPCTSGGCPTCTTAAQRAFVDGTRMAFGDPPRASVVANVVYVRAAVRDGDLDGRAFDALRRKLEQALADCVFQLSGDSTSRRTATSAATSSRSGLRMPASSLRPGWAIRGSKDAFDGGFRQTARRPGPFVSSGLTGKQAAELTP
jgi:hypothetical protein